MATIAYRLAVLLVSNNVATRCLTARKLEPYFSIATAGKGAEALEKSLVVPDIILIDANLPDISGFEVCRRIKENPATAHIPVLHFCEGDLAPASRSTALESGIDGFLAAPVEPAALMVEINSLLRPKETVPPIKKAVSPDEKASGKGQF